MTDREQPEPHGSGDRHGNDPSPVRSEAQSLTQPIAIVTEALSRLRFGDIRLTVHNGRVVQVDVTEKTRLAMS